MSQVLEVVQYKRMPRVTVGEVVRQKTAQLTRVPSTGYILKPFTGNGDGNSVKIPQV